MAELNDTIKVSNQTKNDLLERKKKGGHSSIDSLIRTTNLENDLLKIENKELQDIINLLQANWNELIVSKCEEIEELKKKLGEIEQETENK